MESRDELHAWLSARGFREETLDFSQSYSEWYKAEGSRSTIETLKISDEIFDEEGKLKPFNTQDWSDNYVNLVVTQQKKSTSNPFSDDLDDDIPF